MINLEPSFVLYALLLDPCCCLRAHIILIELVEPEKKIEIIFDLCTVDGRQPASGCYQFFWRQQKDALCLSTDSTYFPIAGQHISACVCEIFNHKKAPLAQGGGQGLMKQTCRSPTHRHKPW